MDCGGWLIEEAWEEEWLKNMNWPTIVGVSFLCSNLFLSSLLGMMLLTSNAMGAAPHSAPISTPAPEIFIFP